MQRRTKIGPAWVAGLLIAGVAVALSGCAAGAANPHIGAVLDTPREAEDAWPAGAADIEIDAGSSRLVGTVDQVDYFVASCTGNESGLAISGIGIGSARISADTVTYPASDGWVQLTEFLLVNPGATTL
ncbi:hypothetical protein [Cryobacterium sp. PAMC25264]|uniref:hypothetical protein n=1 Tax=Cryobacterium sp. PAMC25264 TaxID=2861288 RepID=UPI001C634B4B|nr:hypothetical protein [Cryobacterium sp. PAMC25264]QYF73230.1 hypothetical protein KY500_16065 [Cryobacterium sp. PAMC25264]